MLTKAAMDQVIKLSFIHVVSIHIVISRKTFQM